MNNNFENEKVESDLTSEDVEERLLSYCRTGNYKQVVYLFDRYSDNPGFAVNCRDGDANTPLILAGRQGHGSIVQELLRAAPDVTLENKRGQTVMHFSTTAIQKMIFESMSSCTKCTDRMFCNACWLGNVEVVERRLSKEKMRIDESVTSVDGVNCFNLTIKNIVQLDQISVQNKLSYKPAQVLQSLLNHASDLPIKDRLLHMIASKVSKNSVEVCRVLLSKGFEISDRDQFDFTPIHVAARSGNAPVLEFLLSRVSAKTNKSTFIDCQGKAGNTPLHLAATEGREEIVRILLSHGASRDIVNSQQYTPLQLAKSVRIKNILSQTNSAIVNLNPKETKLSPEISFLHNRASTAIPSSAGPPLKSHDNINIFNQELSSGKRSTEPNFPIPRKSHSSIKITGESIKLSTDFSISQESLFKFKSIGKNDNTLKQSIFDDEDSDKSSTNQVIYDDLPNKLPSANQIETKKGESANNKPIESKKPASTNQTSPTPNPIDSTNQNNTNETNKSASATSKPSESKKTASTNQNSRIPNPIDSTNPNETNKIASANNKPPESKKTTPTNQITQPKKKTSVASKNSTNKSAPNLHGIPKCPRKSSDPIFNREKQINVNQRKKKGFSDGKLILPEMVYESDFESESSSTIEDTKDGIGESESISWKRGEQLGKGSYGIVWKGMLEDGRYIAVKEIPVADMDEMSAGTINNLREIHREIDILRNIHHRNIVKYIGASDCPSCIEILMEFVSGGSIAFILSKFGSLSTQITRIYTKQIVAAVEFLHEKSIIHRDLKAANIMVTPKGVIKIIDFGCAKRIGNLKTTSSLSLQQQSRLQGSVYWLAPEVINGDNHTGKSDVWSIGCTVIEMITTKPPWSELHLFAALYAIGSGRTPPLNLRQYSSSIDGILSSDICDFVEACLTRNPDSRPTSADLATSSFLK